MGLIKTLGRYAWRKFALDGVSSSGFHKPTHADIFAFIDKVDEVTAALSAAGSLKGEWDASSGTFPGGGVTAKGDTWLVTTAGTTGARFFAKGDRIVSLVVNASTSVFGVNWGVIPANARTVVAGVDEGAGTANAIQVTTEDAVTDGTVVLFSLFRETTGPTVTVSVNGGPALTLMTPRDTDASALAAGQEVWFRVRASDSTARMVNDNDIATLIAQAEAVLADFQTQYLGQFADNPTTDVNGNAIIEGAFYWNTVSKVFRYWDGDSWETFPNATAAPGSITNDKLADVPEFTVKGRATAGTGGPEDLTAAQTRDLLDPLRGFYADGVTDDTANWAALRAAYPDLDVDGKGSEYLVTAIPPGPCHNGFWVIENYEGDLSVRVPFNDGSLPVRRSVLISLPGHASWPENSGWYSRELGMKGVGYSISDHISNDEHQVMHQYGEDGRWHAPVPLWGADQDDAPKGYWHEGGCCINGVEFALIRTEPSSSLDHKLMRRNLARRVEATNVIQSRSGTTTFRIYRDTLDIGITEGHKANFILASSTVGGQTISGTKTVTVGAPTVLPSSFVEFSNGGSNFTSTALGGDFTQIEIPESDWQEVKIGTKSLGQALTDHSGGDLLIAMAPVLLGLTPIPSRKDGALYVTFGGGGTNVGVARIGKLFGGTSEAEIELLFPFTGVDDAYGEPAVAVSATNENHVFVTLRSDTSTVPPGLAITTDGFATQPSATTITAVGGYMMDNPNPCTMVYGPDGTEYLFVASTGNRGGNDLSKYGWGKIPVYMFYAPTADLLADGAEAFKVFKVGEVNYYDPYQDTGPSARSGAGVGTLIYLENGKLEYICGDMRPMNAHGAPLASVVSFEMDISRFIGRAPAENMGQFVEQGTLGTLTYIGLSADVTAGNIFAPERKVVSTFPDRYVAGVFTCPQTGWYEIYSEAQFNGTGTDQYLELWDEDAAAAYSRPAMFDDSTTGLYRWSRIVLASGQSGSFSGSRPVFLRAGQRVSLRCATGTTAKATAVSNVLRITRIA